MIPLQSGDGLFLMGHGTKSLVGQQQFLQLVSKAKNSFHLPVSGGFIELAEPDMSAALETIITTEHLKRLVIIPVVLFPAGHMKDDGPNLTRLAKKLGGRDLEVIYTSHLGLLPEILSVLEERITEAMALSTTDTADPTGVLLVGRGSSDPDGNAEMYKAMRLLIERSSSDFSAIQPAFVSLALPTVPQGLDILRRLGYSKIVIQPFFLFHGTLIDRMFEQAKSWASTVDEAPTIMRGQAIGPHSHLLQAIEFRLQEGLGNTVRTSCDLCIYRTPTIRTAERVGY